MTLARALYAHAARTLPLLDDEARVPSLAAIDRFVAAPSPARYLAASRALSAAAREIRVAGLRAGASTRSWHRGMAAMTQVPGLDPALATELQSLPIDAAAGCRLEALAALLAAHHELTARVAAAADELRKMLDFDAAEPPPKKKAVQTGKASARTKTKNGNGNGNENVVVEEGVGVDVAGGDDVAGGRLPVEVD